MSHYTRDYGSLPFLEAERQALADSKEYLGPKGWRAVKQACAEGIAPRQLRFQLAMFAGIEGYPVGAIIRELIPASNETGDYGYLPD